MEHTLNYYRDYARGNWSIIYFNDLCRLIEIYIYVTKKHHSQVIPQQSTQTQQICHYRHTRITSGFFVLYDTSVNFSSHKTHVPSQKFPFLFSL